MTAREYAGQKRVAPKGFWSVFVDGTKFAFPSGKAAYKFGLNEHARQPAKAIRVHDYTEAFYCGWRPGDADDDLEYDLPAIWCSCTARMTGYHMQSNPDSIYCGLWVCGECDLPSKATYDRVQSSS